VPADKRPVPFALDSAQGEPASQIEFRTAAQMSEQDRALAADAESSIKERAGFADLAFNEGTWSYRQLVCAALPHHLFLRFERNGGAGDVSMFSASIPRNGQGRVRIIPILRRSYSLFAPAPVNAMTIAAFNHIRTEDGADARADWLGTGLCYAALAGANPQPKPADTTPGGADALGQMHPMLDIPLKGGAIIRIMDRSGSRRSAQWKLTFNGKGKLLKASRQSVTPITATAVPPAAPLKPRAIPASSSR